MTKEEIIQELADALKEYWHPDDSTDCQDIAGGLEDAVARIVMAENPKLYDKISNL